MREFGHPVYRSMGTTIFEAVSARARETGAINLGQGFPDDALFGDAKGPPELVDALVRAVTTRSHQYPPSAGLPELRDAIAAFYARRQGLALAREQVLVTSGATEGIAVAILALVEPGSEVLLFAPAYDAYAPLVRRCGAVPVFVPLAPPACGYDEAAIRAAITPATRAMIVNDPLNPYGTAMSAADRAMLARICGEHDLVAICDEVWEEVRFDGRPHASLLAEPGMAARALKIGSAGKLFGMTGWKIGWLAGSVELIRLVGRAHQFATFTTPPPLQWAVAEGLALPDAWFAEANARWAGLRARLAGGLAEAGLAVLPNAASWFLVVDLAASGLAMEDATFSARLLNEAGVATIPCSALYEPDDTAAPRALVRFCYTKPEAVLDEAMARVKEWMAGERAEGKSIPRA